VSCKIEVDSGGVRNLFKLLVDPAVGFPNGRVDSSVRAEVTFKPVALHEKIETAVSAGVASRISWGEVLGARGGGEALLDLIQITAESLGINRFGDVSSGFLRGHYAVVDADANSTGNQAAAWLDGWIRHQFSERYIAVIAR
jgi:hypothetical protein